MHVVTRLRQRLPSSAQENLRLRLWLLRLLPDAGRPAVTALVTLFLVQSVLPAATALATVALIDAIEAGPDAGLALPLLAVGGVLFVGQACGCLIFPLADRVGERINAAHRSRLIDLALQAPTVEPLEDQDVQNLLRTSRGESEHWVEKRPGDGVFGVLDIVRRWAGFGFSAIVVASWAWWLVPALAVPALVVREINRREWVRHFRIWVDGIVHQRRYAYWAEQASTLESAKELRVFGFGPWLIDRHQEHLHGHLDAVWRDDLRAARAKWRLFLLAFLPLALVYVVVGLQATNDQASLGVLAALLGAGWAIFTHMTGVGDLLNLEGCRPLVAATDDLRVRLGGDGTAQNDADDADDADHPAAAADHAAGDPAHAATDHSQNPVGGVGGPGSDGTPRSATSAAPPLVRFENVVFRYRTGRAPVLDGLDLELRPRELLAIVGANGAGKSTLTKLLAGLYTPSSGRITADGQDIRALGLDAWRRRLTVVQQDFVRYRLSLTENVALGQVPATRRPGPETGPATGLDTRPESGPAPSGWPDPDITRVSVDDAGFGAVAAGLPNGWETPLTRSRAGGVDLSGGQWQQVALARGLYATHAGAKILVLDEPTAHLDVRTEAELFDRLAHITRDVTTVLISHRLSTVRRADRIVLLDGGRITEQGSHDELMASGGVYAQMFTLQAERFRRGFDDRIEEGELL